MGRHAAVFGGSFDPIHVGHLTLARHAREACDLDEVMFVPVGAPPHKAGPAASAEDRLAMVTLAIDGEPKTSVSRIEVDRQGKSYTVDTLSALLDEDPNLDLHLLIGADNAVEMGSWHEPERVLELSRVTVLCRPGWHRGRVPSSLAGRMTFLDSPLIDCSSTEIRTRLLEGASVEGLVADCVTRYIESHRLYGVPS